jgi:hypothetical protein
VLYDSQAAQTGALERVSPAAHGAAADESTEWVQPHYLLRLVEHVYCWMGRQSLLRGKLQPPEVAEALGASTLLDAHNSLLTAWSLVHWHVLRDTTHGAGGAETVCLDRPARIRLAACLVLATRFELENGETVDEIKSDAGPHIGYVARCFLTVRDQRLFQSVAHVRLLRRAVEHEELRVLWPALRAGPPGRRSPSLFAVATRSAFARAERWVWSTTLLPSTALRVGARAAAGYYARCCALAGRLDLLHSDVLSELTDEQVESGQSDDDGTTLAFAALALAAVGQTRQTSARAFARAKEIVRLHRAQSEWVSESYTPFVTLEFEAAYPPMRLGATPAPCCLV